MTAEPAPWVPNEEERRAIRAAILRDRPDLAGNEPALFLAEERVVSWVMKREKRAAANELSFPAPSKLNFRLPRFRYQFRIQRLSE